MVRVSNMKFWGFRVFILESKNFGGGLLVCFGCEGARYTRIAVLRCLSGTNKGSILNLHEALYVDV